VIVRDREKISKPSSNAKERESCVCGVCVCCVCVCVCSVRVGSVREESRRPTSFSRSPIHDEGGGGRASCSVSFSWCRGERTFIGSLVDKANAGGGVERGANYQHSEILRRLAGLHRHAVKLDDETAVILQQLFL
jgi:hypothetical protein